MRVVSLAVLALCAAGCPPPIYADDSSDAQQTLKVLGQLQALQSANSDQALYQTGFAFGETFASAAGEPEIAVGLQVLQGVLAFSGVLGGSSGTNVTQVLATLTIRVIQLQNELDTQRNAINAVTTAVATDRNRQLGDQVYALHLDLMRQLYALYPPSGQNQVIQQRLGLSPGPGNTPPAEPVSSQTARQAAFAVLQDLDTFIAREDSVFLGDDIVTSQGVKSPVSGLKPHPALDTYLFGLQLWITAMEIESGGTDAGHKRILQDKGFQGQMAYPAELKKHIAFLRSKVNGGVDPNYPDPIQDRIVNSVSCIWTVNGQIGSSTAYPDAQGMCSAGLTCRDDITRTFPKIPPVAIRWKQTDRNSFCQLDPSGQALSGGGVPPYFLDPIERGLQETYGLMAMDRVAAMLAEVAAYGTATQANAAPLPVGSFGGKNDAPFFVYAVDGSGAVKNYTGFRNQPLPQAAPAGTITNIKTLIPGGDKTFYALTTDGKLNWYQFTPARQSGGAQPAANTVTGPVTVASGFNAYKQVFGGADGVIYAVQNDGTLLWFRHAGFANGGGPATMTGPKPVAPGFGQFKSVFSAGSGIIYAVAADGSLQWYRHKNYLTGVADATNAKNTAGAKNTGVRVDQNFAGPTQLEGPVNVGSGWGNFLQVIPTGDGVVLAVQSDGTLLWYRHDDYLTGVSTVSAATAPGVGTGVQNKAAQPVAWGTQAAAGGQQNAAAGNNSLASSWGAPAQAAGVNAGSVPVQRSALGTAQSGTQPQARVASGTMVAPSSLHGGAESMQTVRPGTSPQSMGGAGSGIGARQNVASTSALGAAMGTPHWEGPATIDAHSGWQGFSAIAAVLPGTVQTTVIK